MKSKGSGSATSGRLPKPPPRRHHFVAQMLQRRFVDEDGQLNVFTTKNPAHGVFKTHPGKVFVESHLYSKIDADGRRDTTMEDRLADLEDRAAPVIEKIVASARAGQAPRLRPGEMETWLTFFMIQWKRVPDLHRTIATDAEVSADFDALVDDLRQIRPDRAAELDRLNEPEVRARMIQNARVDALAMASADVLDALRSRGMGIGRVTRPDKKFILASRPVVKLTHPGKTHIRHPECEMWLAVAPDIIVGLGKGPGQETLVEIRDPSVVRHHNLACAGQSSTLASASRRLVESLAGPR